MTGKITAGPTFGERVFAFGPEPGGSGARLGG
jgi:hypothetical protein